MKNSEDNIVLSLIEQSDEVKGKMLGIHVHVYRISSDRLLIISQDDKTLWRHTIYNECREYLEKVVDDVIGIYRMLPSVIRNNIYNYYEHYIGECLYKAVNYFWDKVVDNTHYSLYLDNKSGKLIFKEIKSYFTWEKYDKMKAKFFFSSCVVDWHDKKEGFMQKVVPYKKVEVFDNLDRKLGHISENRLKWGEHADSKDYRSNISEIITEAMAIWNLNREEARSFVESLEKDFIKAIAEGNVKEAFIKPKKEDGKIVCVIEPTTYHSEKEIARRSENVANLDNVVVAKMSFAYKIEINDYPVTGKPTYESHEEMVRYGIVKTLDDIKLFNVYCDYKMIGTLEPLYYHHHFRFENREEIIPVNPIPDNTDLAALMVGYEEEFKKAILQFTFDNNENMDGILEGDIVFKKNGWMNFELIPTLTEKQAHKDIFGEEEESAGTRKAIVIGAIILFFALVYIIGSFASFHP